MRAGTRQSVLTRHHLVLPTYPLIFYLCLPSFPVTRSQQLSLYFLFFLWIRDSSRRPSLSSLQLACRTRPLVSLRPRRSTRLKGQSLPSHYDTILSFISHHPSPPRLARSLAQLRPTPVPRVVGTAPAVSMPLVQRTNGSVQTASSVPDNANPPV